MGMAVMDFESALSRFQQQAEEFARRWFGEATIIESERRYNFMRLRIRVNPVTFIELYTNAQNGRGSYALIHHQRRIFGYDGVKEWHRHPPGGSGKARTLRQAALVCGSARDETYH